LAEGGDGVHPGTIAFVQSLPAKGCSIDFAVLASGAGTNLQAILDSGIGGLQVVISDVQDAAALQRAAAAGVPTEIVRFRGHRSAFTESICETAARYGAEALVLAGFMRILGPEAMERFPHRILNIHPSLLPAFPGVNAVSQALSHGVTLTGVTVHFVDEQVDHGPIIAQRAVPVLPGDDEESLHARIQKVEHELYPRVIAAFLRGEVLVEQGKVVLT
jgi:phosphoribosylglycinamide formyltransferase-1